LLIFSRVIIAELTALTLVYAQDLPAGYVLEGEEVSASDHVIRGEDDVTMSYELYIQRHLAYALRPAALPCIPL